MVVPGRVTHGWSQVGPREQGGAHPLRGYCNDNPGSCWGSRGMRTQSAAGDENLEKGMRSWQGWRRARGMVILDGNGQVSSVKVKQGGHWAIGLYCAPRSLDHQLSFYAPKHQIR